MNAPNMHALKWSRSGTSRIGTGLRAACALALALALAACSRAGNEEAAQARPAWREFANADGSVTAIPAPPQRILSTSVAITGTLLAIDAPVAASASTAKNVFFAQWGGIAAERGVENVWPAGSVSLEAAYAARPDLIVVAISGNDSALPQLAELKKVAPTVLLDYGAQTWQDLALELGRATGREAQAQARIAAFDRYVADAAARLKLPEGQANIVSFNGAGMSNPIATGQSAHGRLLRALGFQLEEPDPAWHSSSGARRDFVWTQYENLTRLTAQTTFLLSVGDEDAKAFLEDPVLANLPSVRARQVYGLGRNSFRIDYYSATEVVDGIVEKFGQ